MVRASLRPPATGARIIRLALAMSLPYLALAPVAGAAQNGSQVVTALVYHAGNSGPVPDSGSLSALEASCPLYAGPNIELYTSSGEAPADQVNFQAAWSIGGLLSCLATPIPLAAVTGVTVIGPGGPELAAEAQLTSADLASPSDFSNPSESPLIYSDGDGLVYDRPWRGGTDANAADQVVVPAPSPLVIEVFEGPLLTVSATASSTATAANRPVTFSASVGGAPAGSTLSYSWSFGGAAPVTTGRAPTVRFPAAGVYDVTVEVTDGAGGGGGASVRVTVGHPTTRQGRPSGPRSGVAGHSGGATSVSSGHRSGRRPTYTRRHRSGADRPASTRSAAQLGGEAGNPTLQHPGTASETRRTRVRAPERTAAHGHTPTNRRRAHATSHRRIPQRPRAGVAVPVAGRLIAAPPLLSSRRSPLVTEASVTPPATAAASGVAGSGAGAGVASGAAAIVLVGLGALRELRSLRRRGRRPTT
jgi:hypothetical protein